MRLEVLVQGQQVKVQESDTDSRKTKMTPEHSSSRRSPFCTRMSKPPIRKPACFLPGSLTKPGQSTRICAVSGHNKARHCLVYVKVVGSWETAAEKRVYTEQKSVWIFKKIHLLQVADIGEWVFHTLWILLLWLLSLAWHHVKPEWMNHMAQWEQKCTKWKIISLLCEKELWRQLHK